MPASSGASRPSPSCGIIHSPLESGALFLPWAAPDPVSLHLAAGYGAMVLNFLGVGRYNSGKPLAEG